MRNPFTQRLCFLAFSALCLLLASCEVEEELMINHDGTGTYRARVAVEKQVGEAIEEVRADAEERGFTVVEEGETADRKFIILSRDFTNVAELNDNDDTYRLDIHRSGFVKASYQLHLDFNSNPAANGFSRTMKVTMPAAISTASGGSVSGKTVSWDCSHPGTLNIQSAGLVLPLTGPQGKLALAVVGIGLLALVSLRIFSRRKASRCENCSIALDMNARFCPKCGAPRQVPTPLAGAG